MKPAMIMLFLILSFYAIAQDRFEVYSKKAIPELNRKLEVGRLIHHENNFHKMMFL